MRGYPGLTARDVLTRTSARVTARAARGHVAGDALEDATSTARALAGSGIPCTLAYWNGPREGAADVAGAYTRVARAAADLPLPGQVAAKLPAIAMDAGRLSGLAATCRDHGVRLQLDSIAPADTDATLAQAAAAAASGADVGVTLPGRWPRSRADAGVVASMGCRVRLVKGQWRDPAGDLAARDGVLALVDRLAGSASVVSVATHDAILAREALGRLTASGTPAELELLLGLPLRAPLVAARERGVPVRLYVPFGSAWLPYAASEALRHPRLLLHLLRDWAVGASRRDIVEQLRRHGEDARRIGRATG